MRCTIQYSVLTTLVVGVWTTVPTVVRASDQEAKDLIHRYESSLAAFGRATFTVNVKGYSEGPDSLPDGPRQDTTRRVWRDGPRWKEMFSSTIRTMQQGKLHKHEDSGEIVVGETGKVMVSTDKGRPRSRLSIISTLGKLSEHDRYRVGFGEYAVVVTGRIQNDRLTLPETLKQATVSVKTVRLDGREMRLLEAKGPWGEHAVWLDPARGYTPRRIIQIKQGDDKITMDADLDVTMATVPKRNSGPWRHLRHQFDATRDEVIGGRHVVTGFTWTRKIDVPSLPTGTQRFVVSFSDIKLNPDFTQDPFVVTTPIPNGNRVTVTEQPSINHEWRDGQVVKSVDDAAVEHLSGSRFFPGSTLGRGLVVLALLSLVAVPALFFLRRRAGR